MFLLCLHVVKSDQTRGELLIYKRGRKYESGLLYIQDQLEQDDASENSKNSFYLLIG